MPKEQRQYTIHKAPGAHLTRDHRTIIERAWNKNCELKKPHSVCWVAKRIGLAPSTLHDELARGCAIPPKPRGSLPERFPSYSARTAQAVCEERKREHGPRGKVTTVINQHLTHYIRELRMSPETAAYHLSKEHGIDIGFKTIYNHIHAGRLTVTDDDLLRGRQPPRKRRARPVAAKTCKTGHLIDDIPERDSWQARDTFGHWEMDTVHSATGKRGGLLVLIERQTRYYLIAKLPALTQKAVHRALRKLIASGRIITMKSLLTDNGSEFLNLPKIQSIIRSTLHYTHAYASYEKGSVEHANGLLRYHFPKGTDFSKVRASAIATAERAINNTLRRTSLHGTTAAEAYQTHRPILENSRPA